MDLQALKNEIENDPEHLGYAELAAAGRDQDVADLLNRRDRAAKRLVPCWEVIRLASLGWTWANLDLASRSHESLDVQRAAITARDWLQRWQSIDLDANSGALQLLRAGNVIESDAELTAILALGDATVSRAQELWGEKGAVQITVTAGDVAMALRG